jgi:hypothetical protein
MLLLFNSLFVLWLGELIQLLSLSSKFRKDSYSCRCWSCDELHSIYGLAYARASCCYWLGTWSSTSQGFRRRVRWESPRAAARKRSLYEKHVAAQATTGVLPAYHAHVVLVPPKQTTWNACMYGMNEKLNRSRWMKTKLKCKFSIVCLVFPAASSWQTQTYYSWQRDTDGSQLSHNKSAEVSALVDV